MSSTVPCPECRRPAHVLDSFTIEVAGAPVRYLRVQCEGPPSFLVTVEDVADESSLVPTVLEDHDGAA
jgi:hypothetical protein